MRYAPIDPEDTVVLFADLQAGIIERSATQEVDRLRRAVAALAQLAKLFDMPTVMTAAPGAQGAPQITPEIAAALGELTVHVRNTTDAFTHLPTREAILASGRQTLLIAGVATEIIVQHSALSGHSLGLKVQVVVDACGGLSTRTEDAALRRLVHSGIVTTSLASLAGQLAGDFTQSRGSQSLGILYQMAAP